MYGKFSCSSDTQPKRRRSRTTAHTDGGLQCTKIGGTMVNDQRRPKNKAVVELLMRKDADIIREVPTKNGSGERKGVAHYVFCARIRLDAGRMARSPSRKGRNLRMLTSICFPVFRTVMRIICKPCTEQPSRRRYKTESWDTLNCSHNREREGYVYLCPASDQVFAPNFNCIQPAC